jgi:tripartite-type tricarboxylate transporter receptor subunit TctC
MRRVMSMIGAALLFGAAIAAQAQQYPTQTVRLILPFPTGPGFVIGQVLSDGLREALKQPVTSEPRSGAGGSIAMEFVARAAPDGHTLFIASPILTITPVARPSLKLDPLRDFAPVAMVGTIPNVLVVHPSVPAKSIKEFIRVARQSAGRLTYGSSGVGSTNHMVTELFSMLTDVQMRHTPYKSATFAVLDLVRGDVDMVIGAYTSVSQFIPSGRVRVLGVLSTKRMSALPDVPTAIEQGMSEMVAENYYGVLAPAGTSPQIIERLAREIVRIMQTPDAQKLMAKSEITLDLKGPAEFAAFIRSDHAKWQRVAREAKLKLE